MLSSTILDGHDGICSAIEFASSDQIISASDDHKLLLRDIQENKIHTSYDLGPDTFPVDLAILSGNKKLYTICIGCTDGSICLLTVSANQVRLEKKWTAHQGACIQCCSSPSGSEILTCGEDGTVKVWSRAGLLRTTLVSLGQAVYAVDWSPDGTHVVLSQATKIQTKSLQPSARFEIWNGHSSLITALAWGSSDIIASGGEDGRYKLWDRFGRQLYASRNISNQPITSLRFSPNHDTLLVGTFGLVMLCDQLGSVISSIHDNSLGSIFRLSWSTDGRVAVGGSGSGKVLQVEVCGMEVEDTSHHLTQVSSKKIEVMEVENGSTDMIETTERILSMSVGFRHFICITTKEIQIFTKGRINTPQIIQHRDINIQLIRQSPTNFLVLDGLGISIYSYEGRIQAQTKYNFSLNSLQSLQISINSTYCLLTDPREPKYIIGFESNSGKSLATSAKSPESHPIIQHKDPIKQISLQADSKILVFLDQQKEVFITELLNSRCNPIRFISNVESILFSSSLPVLGVLRDSLAQIVLNPSVIMKDHSLLNHSIVPLDMDLLGRSATYISFTDSAMCFRNSDGSHIRAIIPVYAQLLLERIKQKRLKEAVHICRMTNQSYLWAVLGGYCLETGDLDVMQECFSFLGNVDKLEQIERIRILNQKPAQGAEIRLLGNDQDAARLVLKQCTTFAKIKMLTAQGEWAAALAVAVKNESHVDTVLYLRKLHLIKREKEETDKKFIEMRQNIDVEWSQVKAKVEQEAV